MLRQYRASQQRGGFNPHGVGSIDIGSIAHIQDGQRPMGGFPWPVVSRSPWIIESWHNREYHPAARGRPSTTYMLGGHLATCRCLRTGRRKLVADWMLRQCDDMGLMRLGNPLPIPVSASEKARQNTPPVAPRRSRRRRPQHA